MEGGIIRSIKCASGLLFSIPCSFATYSVLLVAAKLLPFINCHKAIGIRTADAIGKKHRAFKRHSSEI